MMISFISIQNFGGPIPALPNRRDPVRFEVVDNQRTSHPIFKLFFPRLAQGLQSGRHLDQATRAAWTALVSIFISASRSYYLRVKQLREAP